MMDKHMLDSFNVFQEAQRDFNLAYRKGFWNAIKTWLGRHSNELLPLDEVLKRLPIRGQYYKGMMQIPIDHIIGSVSRYHDFDRAFLPRQTHTRDRWENVDRAHLRDVILPPIEVYKVGETFFVKDGNHRVSVARERGQAFIDANVIEITTNVNIIPGLQLEDMILKEEQSIFLASTGIKDIVPGANIEFSIPGQYLKLEEHIRVHQWYMGERLLREVFRQEAIRGWFEDVYEPLLKVIRRLRVLREFPDRTETDLYLWIIEHRWYLMEEYHRKVSLERAASDFTERFSRRPFRHLRNWLRYVWKRTFGHRARKMKRK